MENYYLDESNRFIINDYQQKVPFTDLLPGIAGLTGIPMWIFYVNRGQAISSFGTANKDYPIMEFQPANKAYQLTSLTGFRTFIKRTDDKTPSVYEPFNHSQDTSRQEMMISISELALKDESISQKIRTEVLYFSLPQEPVAGLVREVKITNLDQVPAELEVLDGMPVILPYGLTNHTLKETPRTAEAWMSVRNIEHNIAFYQLRSSLSDSAEVKPVQAGNFAMAAAEVSGQAIKLDLIVNPEIIFGHNTSMQVAAEFNRLSLADLLAKPSFNDGKTPAAIFGFTVRLLPGESVTLHSLYGYASSVDQLKQVAPGLLDFSCLGEKRLLSKKLIDELTTPILTKTSSKIFDAYCRQTFLDNILRGGWPLNFGHNSHVRACHVYSRKHGDPERDYNDFYLAPEFYTQGNGNYRDVNQNRRSDVWFAPWLEDYNVQSFMSLIQTDGYNPLVVKGTRFWIDPVNIKPLLDLAGQSKLLAQFLKKPFTPGGLLTWLQEQAIGLRCSPFEFLNHALQVSEQFFDADYGEGFWTDHWIYNLDLIESFQDIYPDQMQAMLCRSNSLTFFESPVFVQPRCKKYVLVGDQPRQYHAIAKDQEKAALIKHRREFPSLMRTKHGHGPIFRTNLITKLSILAIIKFATLDPAGMGIEMEAGRPSWCDALNGLPGLFGSSFAETLDLLRLLKLLLGNMPEQGTCDLPLECYELLQQIEKHLKDYTQNESSNRDFEYWDAVASAREVYREKTRFGYDGACEMLTSPQLVSYFTLLLKKVQDGIDRAVQQNGGIPPTYFTYTADRFEMQHGTDGKPVVDEMHHPYVKVLSFQQAVLPLFLEAPARMLKQCQSREAARDFYQKIRQSGLYDQKLKMYKTNLSLSSQSMEIGRLRVFNPGWLENESVFLHMEYKYILATLKAGLVQDFFNDFRSALIPFQDPDRYGRSPLENVTFIVSSANPDPALHGRGFVARLTGSTAEFLSMRHLMLVGPAPFFLDEGNLCLRLQPKLPGWLFSEDGKVSFAFLGQCLITYDNPEKVNTYDDNVRIKSITLYDDANDSNAAAVIDIEGPVIPAPYASMVREGKIKRIKASLSISNLEV